MRFTIFTFSFYNFRNCLALFFNKILFSFNS